MTADAIIADPQASTSLSTLVDEITRRSIELSISELGPPPCPLTWFALGSHGRREPATRLGHRFRPRLGRRRG